jgi:hypothetical protein
MALRLVTAPTVEPLTVSDAVVKQALRVIDTAEDAYITLLLTMAREACERITRRALMTQTWALTMDKFPAPGMETSSANWYGPAWGTGPGPLTVTRPDGVSQTEIWLPKCPIASVSSIVYWDQFGVQQTLDPSQYIVDTASEPGRITPAVNSAWPATWNRANAVTVTYVAGWPDAASVPASVKQWILMTVATLYENREAVAILQRGSIQELPYVDTLLDSLRVQTFDPPSYWS